MDTDTHTLTRTITYKLDLQPLVVSELSYHWSELCNYISRIAYHDKIYNLKLLYARAYGPAREMSPLPAYYVVSAIRHVLARYATVRSNKHVIHKPLFFKPNGAIPLVLGNTISYIDSGISIATHIGRIKGIRAHNGMWVDKYKDWKRGSATLYVKARKVYLGVVHQREKSVNSNGSAVIGVDLGIRNIATITDGNHNNVFYSGKAAWKKKKRFAAVRAQLQRKKAQRGRSETMLLWLIESQDGYLVVVVQHIRTLLERVNMRARCMGRSRTSAGCKSLTPEIPLRADHRPMCADK